MVTERPSDLFSRKSKETARRDLIFINHVQATDRDDHVSKHYTEEENQSQKSESISVTVEHDDDDGGYVQRHRSMMTKCTRLFHVSFAARTGQRAFRRIARSLGLIGDGHVVLQVQRFLHLTAAENFIPTRVFIGHDMAKVSIGELLSLGKASATYSRFKCCRMSMRDLQPKEQ